MRRRLADASSCCGEMPGPGSPEPGDQRARRRRRRRGAPVALHRPGHGVTDRRTTTTRCSAASRTCSDCSHLGYAGLPGETYFGADIFNRACGASSTEPSSATIHAPSAGLGLLDARPDPGRELERRERLTPCRCARSTARTVRWRSLAAATHENHLTFTGALGATYQFQRPGAAAGPFATATTVVPSGTRVTHGRFSRALAVGQAPRRLAAARHPGRPRRVPRFALRYVGGALSVIGETGPRRRASAPRHPRRPRAHASPARHAACAAGG